MQSTRAFIMCFQNARYISSSSIYSNISRESRFMRKLMHVTRKTKKRWHDDSTSLSINISLENKSPSMHTQRRMAIRDKLFMEYITDQISMGEVSDIINTGIEITHVKITADFKCVNVFWIYSNDNAASLVTEEELQRCAKIIRHELSQLRVIGVVPPIQFVKNKQFFIEKEVEEKLAIIASEQDIDESYPEEIQLAVPRISAIENNQTLQKEPLSSNDSEIDESPMQLPVMKHDVLGLDHHKIMSRITASLSKSRKAAQRHMLETENTNADSSGNLIAQKVTDFLTQEEKQKLFSDFLAKKRIEEKRKRNMKRLHEQELNNSEEEDEEENDEIELYYENEYDIDTYNELDNKT